jgi:hypothetical protein
MKGNVLLLLAMVAMVAMLAALGVVAGVPDSAASMVTRARDLLDSLRAEQRAKASLPFASDERADWHFVPRARKGIPLGDLDPAQRKTADALLKSGLSAQGYAKATAILTLEGVLREIEGPYRDPGRYYVSVFGAPSTAEPWGWRFEGHHLSLNYTVVGKEGIATSPAFFGANPAEVRQGPHKGLRPLAGEEDLARALLRSLDAAQRRRAVLDDVAPRDIVTGAREKVSPLPPAGIEAKELTEPQRRGLDALLQTYLDRMAPELAADRRRKLQEAGLERIRFAWAGGAEPGQPHYYRLQGPSFLVEYDNTQDGANHIHTVWRDFDGDFGEDLLRRHYREAPHREPG